MVSGSARSPARYSAFRHARSYFGPKLPLGIFAFDGAKGCWGGEKAAHVVFGNYPPEGASIRRADRLAFKYNRGVAVDQWRIADIANGQPPSQHRTRPRTHRPDRRCRCSSWSSSAQPSGPQLDAQRPLVRPSCRMCIEYRQGGCPQPLHNRLAVCPSWIACQSKSRPAINSAGCCSRCRMITVSGLWSANSIAVSINGL